MQASSSCRSPRERARDSASSPASKSNMPRALLGRVLPALTRVPRSASWGARGTGSGSSGTGVARPLCCPWGFFGGTDRRGASMGDLSAGGSVLGFGGGVMRCPGSPLGGRPDRRNGGADGLAGRSEMRASEWGNSGGTELRVASASGTEGMGGKSAIGSSSGCVGRESSRTGRVDAVQEAARMVVPP